MTKQNGLDRRAFLRNAGMTALVGAVSGTTSMAAARSRATRAPSDGPFDFDTPYNRVGTNCIRWDEQIKKYGRENIEVGMGIADMDFQAAPCITKAIAERCRHENWGYRMAPQSLIDAIVAWERRRYGVEVDPETVVVSNGVHPAIIAALHTFSPPGSKVLLTTPTYNGFYSDLRHCRVVPADSPMKLTNGRYSIDFDDLESRIGHDTNTLILCNPQNPTGNCWSADDLMRLGEICLRRRVVVLADEIHCDLVTKGQKYTPFASLPNQAVVDNSITFKSGSKTFSLSAMRTAWFYSTNSDYLARVKANHWPTVNTLGAVANEAALREGEPWLEELLVYLDGNHEFTQSYLRDNVPLVKYTKAQGTYLAWLDVSAVSDRIGAKAKAAEESKTAKEPVTAEDVLQKWFVENAKVHLNAGSEYGTGGDGHMRMNLATSRKLIRVALENISEAVAKL